jgi:N4-gp56 family major capsid protein
MSNVTSYTAGGSNTPLTNMYAVRQLLEHAMPVIVLGKFGDMKPMPQNKTETIGFRRPVPFQAVTVPLQEGITPAPTPFRYEDVTQVLAQYGMVVEVTDKVEDLHENNVIADAAEQAGENVGRTQEAICYGVLKAGTNVHYANGTARNQVNTPVSLTKLRAVVRGLESQKSRKMSRMLDGSKNFQTTPIEACWPVFGHTDLEHDIREIPGFVPCAKYGSQQKLHDYEIGAVEHFRFILSPDLGPIVSAGGTYNGSGTDMVSTNQINADIYPMIIPGRASYGHIPLRGKDAAKPYIIRPNTPSKSDPLGQRGYIGFKFWYASIRLNELWLARLEVAATDLS